MPLAAEHTTIMEKERARGIMQKDIPIIARQKTSTILAPSLSTRKPDGSAIIVADRYMADVIMPIWVRVTLKSCLKKGARGPHA